MDTSLAGLTAQPHPFTVGEKTYQLHPLQLDDFGAMQKWCDSRAANPYVSVSEQLGKGLFTVAQEKLLLEAAVRVASGPKPLIGSAECDALIGTAEGLAKIVHLSIRRGEPKYTEAEALALVKSLDIARAEELQQALDFATLIGGRDEGEDGPKGPDGGSCSTPP